MTATGDRKELREIMDATTGAPSQFWHYNHKRDGVSIVVMTGREEGVHIGDMKFTSDARFICTARRVMPNMLSELDRVDVLRDLLTVARCYVAGDHPGRQPAVRLLAKIDAALAPKVIP